MKPAESCSDGEVRRIIEEAEDRARQVLSEHMDALHAVAEALLAYETLSGEEVRAVLAGEPIARDERSDQSRPSKRGSVPVVGSGASPRRRPAVGPPQVQPQG